MNILLLSRYSHLGASSRVRFYQYIPYLEKEGIHVTIANLLGNDYLEDLYRGKRRRFSMSMNTYAKRLGYLLRCNRYDLVWLQHEIFPWLPAWAETILSHAGVPYVVDYDDAIFHRYNMHPRALVRGLLGRKIDAVMRRAALVTVGNEYLGAYARKAGAKRVAYIPSVIDVKRYMLQNHAENSFFTIGWIGSPTTEAYLYLIEDVLSEFCQHRNTRLILVGSTDHALQKVPREIHAWSEETEVQEILSFDVGIMPQPDEPWAEGKCGYKLIQYMACAKPVIASPIGAARSLIDHNKNGFLAAADTDWKKALGFLREDQGLRQSMGRAGRAKVEKQYTIQVTAPLVISLLKSVCREES
ncbi:MAG: glycosyltransferase family 4 protein [Thermodesulfobacteriota bacterium]